VVNTLAKLARGGSVLELGLATGRTALALAERGLAVAGMESSPAMLDQLRRKPGAGGIRILEGDFAVMRVAEQFDLIFALVNTFSLLETQRRQMQCLENVAGMLKKDGVFVLELFQPLNGEAEITEEGIRLSFRHELKTKTGPRFYKGLLLYPPIEVLDALASAAGLKLKERFGDWRGSLHRPELGNHVSVYGRA